MKIGIDGRLINQTGVGRYTRELVENLVKIDQNNEYFIFLPPEEFQNFNVSRFKKKLIKIRWHSFKEQLILPWILWKEHLDLVHFPYFSVPVLYPGKFIVTIHDLILDHFETGQASTLGWPIYKIKRLGYKIVTWVALHRTQKIITVSQATKREIMDHYKIRSEKIVVIYEAAGVDTNPPLRCEPKQYFLYVGNAYPHKNLERLLEAVVNFKLKISNFKVIMVGPDDYFYKKLKERISQMGLMEQISFYGPASGEELTDLYKNAIALVFPSLMEGFGLPAVEAISNKCLVVCSDIPVFHEILKDAAIYFDPKNITDMVDKLYRIHTMSDEEKESLKSKGLKIIKNYSWEKLARETLEIYNQSNKQNAESNFI